MPDKRGATGIREPAEMHEPELERAERHQATDWNVVVTLQEGSYGAARKLLAKWGTVHRTGFYNVLALTVADPRAFLDQFAAAVSQSPGILNFVSHLIPAQATFDFTTAEEFETRAVAVALGWLRHFAHKRFHVRLHRRGLKSLLSTPREEQFIDDALLKALEGAGTPGHIAFDDPDTVLAVDTIDGRAGMSLWSRDDLKRFPFLGPL